MENLGSDLNIEILRKLSGKDILSVCKTSSKLNKVCTSERYNNLWREKLLEEFLISYRGDKAYEKYIETMKLYERDFYEVTVTDNDYDETFSHFFENKESAIEYIIESVIRDYTTKSYYEIRSIKR